MLPQEDCWLTVLPLTRVILLDLCFDPVAAWIIQDYLQNNTAANQAVSATSHAVHSVKEQMYRASPFICL